MDKKLWEKALAFHGHECPGLAIGFKVCELAAKKMNLSPSFDEEIVCITENDACGIDAIQALMSCTVGKGNLIFKQTGKHAYSFFVRDTKKAMRFYFKAENKGLGREDFLEYLLKSPAEELFSFKEIKTPPPAHAKKFASIKCELCSEAAAENKIRLQEGRKVCLDCFQDYNRNC